MAALSIDEQRAAFERMPPEVRARAEELYRDRYGFTPLVSYINEASPHLPPPAHIRWFCKLIETARLKRKFYTVSWPPRHAKTTTLLHAFPWWLRHDPADTCAYFTYSDRQGRSKSRLARRLAIESGVQMDQGSNDMSEWRTVEGGGLLAGGAGGGLTGQGVSGLFVVDDPYKNRAQADSIIYRENVWEWFTEVVLTRLEGASVIVVHTRWHEDDLIGRIKKNAEDFDDWEHINLPCLAEEGDVLGRDPGDPLWPARFPRHEMLDKKRKIGDWSFAALYQGRPQPRGSNLFREPARFVLPSTPAEWRTFLEGKKLVIGVDPAASEKTYADYSVAVVMAKDQLGPKGRTWILRVIRKQCTVPAFVQDLRQLQAYWKALLAIEAVGGFKAVPQMLRHIDPALRILEIQPTTDKFVRSQGLAAAWNAGEVLVPVGDGADLAWVDPYLQEVLSFTGVKDPHDDQVDATAHGWNALAVAQPQIPRGARRDYGAFG